jgi:hypothetical protein
MIAIGAVAIACAMTLPTAGLAGFSYDSFRYLAGAVSIRDHGVYRDIDGTPQQVWPPGTSLVYALSSRVSGMEPERLILPINLVALALSLFVFAALLRLAGLRLWLSSIVFAAFAWNGALLAETNKLWSDPLALPLQLTVLYCAVRALSVDRRSTRFLLLAAAAAALAIALRFAMVAAALYAFAAALVVCIRERRQWWRMLLPLLAPLLGVALFAAFDAVRGSRAVVLQPLQLRQNLEAFAVLLQQMLPSTAGAVVALIATVVVPMIFARRNLVVLAALSWVALYVAFLVGAQAVTIPSFTTDLRILLIAYPALLLAAGTTAEEVLRRRNTAVAALLTLVLVVTAARAAHYVGGSLVARPASSPRCVSREALVEAIRREAAPFGQSSRVITNAQGLAWYALRRPTLSWPAARPVAGDLTVWIDPRQACEFAVEGAAPASELAGRAVIIRRIAPP